MPDSCYDAELTPAQMETLNNEDMTDIIEYGGLESHWITVMFSEKHELDGIYLNRISSSGYRWTASSGDSKTGMDGVWTSLDYAGVDNVVADSYRDDIVSKALSSRTGVMTYLGSSGALIDPTWRALHLYGTVAPGETPTRLLFLDTQSGDQEFSKVLDYGDVARNQVSVRTIKVKNNSASVSLSSITITAEDLYLNAGGWYTFSLFAGTGYDTSVDLGSLGPGSSRLFYLKQVVPSAETLGPQVARLRATHTAVT